MAEHAGIKRLVSTLTELGFRKRSARILTVDVGDGWLGWLGLNTASRAGPPGELVLHPIVGVRSDRVESCVAEGRGESLHPFLPPTVSEPLRYLAPVSARKDWIFDSSGRDEIEVSANIAVAVSEHGLPFINQTANLASLASRLAKTYSRDQQAAYRWPASLFVGGLIDASRRAAATVQNALGDRKDPAAEELRAFLTWLQIRSQA